MGKAKARAIGIAAAVAAAWFAGGAGPAAALSATRVTVTQPSSTYLLADQVSGADTITVSGSSNGQAGERIDINCYAGNRLTPLVSDLEVQKGGAFAFSGQFTALAGQTCVLRAVPHGDRTAYPPGAPSPYNGPLLAIGERYSETISSGPNVGKLVSHYIYGSQLSGGFAYGSLGECALEVSELYNPLTFEAQPLFSCDGFLWWENGEEKPGLAAPTRSELLVDGHNAYLPANVVQLFAGADELEGFPAESYKYSFSPETGNLTWEEGTETVFCAPEDTFPPTPQGCKQLVGTGVRLYLKAVQQANGRQIELVQYLESTDHRPHEVDLLEDQQFNAPTREGVVWLPWLSPTYTVYPNPGQQLAPPPAGPNTIYLRSGPFEGPIGAITYAAPPEGEEVVGATNGPAQIGWLDLHYHRVVPEAGSTALGFTYSDGFSQGEVEAAAQSAARAYLPTITLSAPPTTTTATVAVSGSATDASGLASVTVDGQPVAVGAGGSFTATVNLQPGPNQVSAQAVNLFGEAAQAQATVTYTPPPPPPPPPAGLVLVAGPSVHGRRLVALIACEVPRGQRCSGVASVGLALHGRALVGARRKLALAGGARRKLVLALDRRVLRRLRRLGRGELTFTLAGSGAGAKATLAVRALDLRALQRRLVALLGRRLRLRCPPLVAATSTASCRARSGRRLRLVVVSPANRVVRVKRIAARQRRRR